MKKTLIASILSTLFLTACVGNKQDNSAVLTDSGLNPQNFVTDINGKKTGLFVLKNKNNMEVCVTNFGGRIVSVMAPDRNGVMLFIHPWHEYYKTLLYLPKSDSLKAT